MANQRIARLHVATTLPTALDNTESRLHPWYRTARAPLILREPQNERGGAGARLEISLLVCEHAANGGIALAGDGLHEAVQAREIALRELDIDAGYVFF